MSIFSSSLIILCVFFSKIHFGQCNLNLENTNIINISESLSNNDTFTDDIKMHSLDHTLTPFETSFYHWFPWKKAKQYVRVDEQCKEDSSINDFPDDIFTKEQRLQGAIVLHFIAIIYFFTISGIVINNYFLPAVQCICDDLKITPDVGAAVFMATATATPEFFTNTISIFIADSDMGIGTVIGSLMWNILGVAALASLATKRPVRMDWVPITRDCVIFSISVALLAMCAWDGKIYFWEALILLIFIIFYYVIMFQSKGISMFMKRKFEVEYRCCNRDNYDLDVEKEHEDNPPPYSVYSSSFYDTKPPATITFKPDPKEIQKNLEKLHQNQFEKKPKSLWKLPKGESKLKTFFWYYSWPINFVLSVIMPDPKTSRKWYPLTFLICVLWIGINSYLIFWMMIIIGYTFSIPESVMGLTIFAIGGCTPEMITGVIMARRGNSAVGIANSLGAASLAILLSLGLPWFLRGVINKSQNLDPFVNMHSNGMEYTVLSLLGVVGALYLCLALTRFTLKRITGCGLFIFYLIFITLAVLVEVDIFFPKEC